MMAALEQNYEDPFTTEMDNQDAQWWRMNISRFILNDLPSPLWADADEDFHSGWKRADLAYLTQAMHPVSRSAAAPKPADSLSQRLANANDYFRRKASEVFNDEASLSLLASMYRNVVVDIAGFDSCGNGIPLAKLTAAGFCEIGANVVYITEAGQQFIGSIEGAWSNLKANTAT